MKISKKILLLITSPFILNLSMHAMNWDVKAAVEDVTHRDDKTEEDRLARLKAKIEADKKFKAEKDKGEKTEAAKDDNGFLDALGNTQGPSLSALVIADHEAYEKRKHEAKVEQELQQNPALGMELFDRLPMELQAEVGQFYDKLVPNYVLRHKRELAPLLLEYPMSNASDILALVDQDIAEVKRDIDRLLQTNQLLHPDDPGYIYNRPLIFARSARVGDRLCVQQSSSPMRAPIVLYGGMDIAGYNDHTYTICFDDEQLKKLMDTYSLEQLTFFVSLAKIPASKSIASVPLSSKDCEIFTSLDAQMQAKLKRLYWWIDFYTPNDRALSINEKIERAQNKIIAHVAYWLQWAKSLPNFCKNVGA